MFYQPPNQDFQNTMFRFMGFAVVGTFAVAITKAVTAENSEFIPSPKIRRKVEPWEAIDDDRSRRIIIAHGHPKLKDDILRFADHVAVGDRLLYAYDLARKKGLPEARELRKDLKRYFPAKLDRLEVEEEEDNNEQQDNPSGSGEATELIKRLDKALKKGDEEEINDAMRDIHGWRETATPEEIHESVERIVRDIYRWRRTATPGEIKWIWSMRLKKIEKVDLHIDRLKYEKHAGRSASILLRKLADAGG